MDLVLEINKLTEENEKKINQIRTNIQNLRQSLKEKAPITEQNLSEISIDSRMILYQGWESIHSSMESGNLIKGLQAFINQYQRQLTDKVDLSEIDNKASRDKVDSDLQSINDAVYEALGGPLEGKYQFLENYLNQIRSNAQTIGQNFDDTTASIKNELTQFKHKMLSPVDENTSRPILLKRSKSSQSQIKAQKKIIKRPQPVRTPLIKRIRPFSPSVDGVFVSGKSLQNDNSV